MDGKNTDRLMRLLPHRAPMLLLDDIEHVDSTSARAAITISPSCAFYQSDKGVPAWVGLEIMGQTAALIAGHQQESGNLESGTGFLFGCRKFESSRGWFSDGDRLVAHCKEVALVGASLATFECNLTLSLSGRASNAVMATAQLSVYRDAIGLSGELTNRELN